VIRFPPAILAAAALVAAAAVSTAAPRSAPRASRSQSNPDVYAGYSWTRAGEAGLHGWALAGSHPYRGDSLRLVVEASGHYGSFAGADLSQLSLMGGARYGLGDMGGVSPFAEVLLGLDRTSLSAAGISASDSDLALAVGGGADYALGARWSVRGLAHLRLVRGEGSLDADPRLSLGVVYRLRRQ
jgi:opacity protein-like surface antigen